QHLDLEVIGETFDGHQIHCSLGFGSSRGGDDSPFAIIILPRYGGILRSSLSTTPRLAHQDLRFDRGTVGHLSLVPSQYGIVRNVGPVPAFISRVEKSGPHPGEFDIRLEHRGLVISMYDVPNRGPLELRPGEVLVVGGR